MGAKTKQAVNMSENEDEKDIDTEDENDADEQQEEKSSGKSISFKIKNPNVKGGISTTTYSQEEHGDSYKDLAEQFKESNTLKPITKDMTDIEIKDAREFNANIKHPIIG